MELGFCDNTDCKKHYVKQPVFLTVLHKDFDYDVCWWCKDCLTDDKNQKMVYMDEFELNRRISALKQDNKSDKDKAWWEI